MVTLAGGMESDFSDSECEIVYSSETSKSSKIVSEEKSHHKNAVNNSYKNDRNYNRSNQQSSASSFRSSTSKSSYQQNRNKNNYNRRQCVDFKSSQVLDDLRYAIMQGNLETVKSILSQGIMVDSILKGRWTSLMYACSFGQSEILSFLLEQGADPNYHRADMFTALMAVCGSKKSEEDLLKCCQILLKNGANVDAHERHFTTSLMFAVREGYSVIVKELLDHGADPNLQDSRGNTALAFGASSGHGQIIRMLLEKGADVNIYNQMGQSPIDLAHEKGHHEIASLLKNGIKESSGINISSELVPKKISHVLEASKLMRPNDSKNFVKVGELELFLSGLELSDVFPIFVEHKLSFHDLLIMDDTELEKIGIHQVGVRKKIVGSMQVCPQKRVGKL